MPLQIQFLGTGGAFTDFRVNYHNNAIVHTDEGPILIDCGGTAVQSLKELNIPVWDLAGVIITHMHGDHIGGLEQLLWERYYTGPQGLPGLLPTPVFTTARLHEALRRALIDCVDEYTSPEGYAQTGGYEELVQKCILPGDGHGMACGGVLFNLCRTPHVVGEDIDKPSYGVFVREEDDLDNGFYYTSDTLFRPDVGTKAHIIFHDCTFGPHYPGTVHTHYSELLSLPADVRKRMVLMHHTQVPEDIDVVADGFAAAADKHEVFAISGGRLVRG